MPLKRLHIRKAPEIFQQDPCRILSVTDWAQCMRYGCNKTFSRHVKRYFGKSAVRLLNELRLKLITELLAGDVSESHYCIARKAGLVDEKSLYDYIKYHLGKSPSRLRREAVLSEISE